MIRLLKDPLLVFLLLGALIFAVDRLGDGFGGLFGDPGPNTIDVTPALRKRLADQWFGQMGRAATAVEIDSLIEQWVREEIYYREAMALGLDRNDTIIRRRLVQKLVFLTEDLADAAPPTEAELHAHYEANPDTFREPERFSFEHRYFSTDRRAEAQADAIAALGDERLAGDPFILQKSYAGRTEREIGDLFGRTFATDLAALIPASDQWCGPIQSAYGWHLIRLTQHSPSLIPPFEEVAEQIGNGLSDERRREANETLYTDLRAKYDIRDFHDTDSPSAVPR